MIPTEIYTRVDALGPAFRLPLRALIEIDEEFGRASMLDHALQVKDGGQTRPVALLIQDWTLALNLMRDLQYARTSKQEAQINRRLTRVLQKAKARAESAPRSAN
jgi:hypothetical protein